MAAAVATTTKTVVQGFVPKVQMPATVPILVNHGEKNQRSSISKGGNKRCYFTLPP